MQVLQKKHKAMIRDENGARSIEILDDGVELGKEKAPNSEMLQNLAFVAEENNKVITIVKSAMPTGTEFELIQKYLVE